MRLAMALVMAGCACAQTALDRPVLGQMLDRDGTLRPVMGVGGNFQLDPPVGLRVLATACSRELCVAKTEFAIVSGSSTAAAPAGPALLALDGFSLDGSSALVYFSAAKQLERWQDGSLAPVDVNVDGEVLALRAVLGGVQLAVRRDSGVWIVSGAGSILDSLPSGIGPVLMLADSVAYSTGDALVLRKSDGAELRFAVTGVTALFALGEGYVEAMTPLGVYALRTVAGREALFVLPQGSGGARFPLHKAPRTP
jgi:hypothetical protein